MAAHQGLMTAGAVMAFIADMYSAVFHAQAAIRAISFAYAAHNTTSGLSENLLKHLYKTFALLCVQIRGAHLEAGGGRFRD